MSSEKLYIPDLKFKFTSVSSGRMTIMTKYGWMEGTSESIRQQMEECRRVELEQQDTNDPYNQPMVFGGEEVQINGYKTFPKSRTTPYMPKEMYNKLVEFWLGKRKFCSRGYDSDEDEDEDEDEDDRRKSIRKSLSDLDDFDNFYRVADSLMCTEWSKQDHHGECYGGYWKAEEGSRERENAYHLSRRRNILELFKLPYPKGLLLETTEIGCGNRNESVQASNVMCAWVSQKYQQLNPGQRLPLAPPQPPTVTVSRSLWNGFLGRISQESHPIGKLIEVILQEYVDAWEENYLWNDL